MNRDKPRITPQMRRVMTMINEGWSCHQAPGVTTGTWVALTKDGERTVRVSYTVVRLLRARGLLKLTERAPVRRWALTERGERRAEMQS